MWRIRFFRIPIFFSVVFPLTLCVANASRAGAVGDAGVAPASSPTPSAEGRTYADQLVGEARRRRLHGEPYWHTLLHYKRTITGLKSLVDDPKFFLSPGGARDPEAELEATIRSFFEPEIEGTKHPVCRFVARYYWIKEQLDLDPSRLPVNECEAFTRLIAEMKPESTTLVFPTSHMNSPASMFGHTLVMYETADKNTLLAYAVNYAALTKETFGPLFAVKGIFGFYRGYFSVLPYYAKLQEYSDIDHRDLWEYPLNFTREETIRSIMHVYELDGIYSAYYFFDENCSYNLLFLLEAGRPSLSLTDQMPPWVIPLDTIRAAERVGLITGPIYRPSKTTKIRRIAALLQNSTRLLALDVAEGKTEPEQILASELSKEERAGGLDLAVEYLQYLYSKKELERDVYTDRLLRLLTARSSLTVPETPQYEISPPPRPEQGHRSNRLQVGLGLDKGKAFQELGFRFAYHTLTDYSQGYPEGSQIVFGDTALRYSFPDHQLKLERLDLVDIVSIAPRDELFKPISWKIRTGLARRVMEDGRKRLIFQLSPGGGLAYRIPFLGLGYVMLETDLNVGEALEDKYALGIGGSIGILKRITDRWNVSLSVRGMYYGLGDRHSLLDVTLTQSYALTPNLAISVDLSRNRTREFYRTEGKIGFNIFF